RLGDAAVVDLRPPSGQLDPAFDAAEARFAVRGMAEAESELSRLARAKMRVVVGFARRGDLERAAHQMQKLCPLQAGPDGPLPPKPGEVAFARLGPRRG